MTNQLDPKLYKLLMTPFSNWEIIVGGAIVAFVGLLMLVKGDK